MNLTSNITNSSSNSVLGPVDPWVESGALVYVAMTIAVCAAVIMCCTWFLTNNETSKGFYAKYCWKGNKNIYKEVVNDEEEEIELRPNHTDSDEEVTADNFTDSTELPTGLPTGLPTELHTGLPTAAFTLEDSDDEDDNEVFNAV